MRKIVMRILEQMDTQDLVMYVYWLRMLLASRRAWAMDYTPVESEPVVIGQ